MMGLSGSQARNLLGLVGVAAAATVAPRVMSGPNNTLKIVSRSAATSPVSAAFDRVRRSIAQHVTLTDEEFDYFTSMLLSRHLKKKERLLAAGEICWFEGFVEDGCLRVYSTDQTGSDNVLYFAPEGSWFADTQSFVSQLPAMLGIDALESSHVFLIDKTSKDRLYDEVPKFERLFRIMTQRALVALQHRMIGSMQQTAAERYRDFKERYPGLENRVPQYQIAAFLGICPEFLSKIRRAPSVHRRTKS
jgi:CRP-like cAMP-binding protein